MHPIRAGRRISLVHRWLRSVRGLQSHAIRGTQAAGDQSTHAKLRDLSAELENVAAMSGRQYEVFVADLMRAMRHAAACGRTSQTCTGVALFGRGEPEKGRARGRRARGLPGRGRQPGTRRSAHLVALDNTREAHFHTSGGARGVAYRSGSRSLRSIFRGGARRSALTGLRRRA